MSSRRLANVVIFKGRKYPAKHWLELRHFMEGEECDPKNIFRLADDTWDTWQYADGGRPRDAQRYRFSFGHLRSWLKPYVKRFCYDVIIGSGNSLTRTHAQLPYVLTAADRHIVEHGIAWLDDLAPATVFEPLWEALILMGADEKGVDGGLLPQAAVIPQQKSRSFWKDLSAHYGAPQAVPSVAPYKQRKPAEISADKSRLIPEPVIRQLVNKLACHRVGIAQMNNFHHLRLCVLLLVISLGRRIEEVLSAQRGRGTDGPLERYPCRRREGEPEDALWFRFSPNKGGSSEWVYVSREWEDITTYCVRQLIEYGDQVRRFALTEEQDLLILVSTWNRTTGSLAGKAAVPAPARDFTFREVWGKRGKVCERKIKGRTTGFTYNAFTAWLNGQAHKDLRKSTTGVMREWNVTSEGSADGPIYHFRTHGARHTRNTAIARHPQIPLLIRQRDLNHRDKNMQYAYQHALDEQNEALMAKINELPLLGQGTEWLNNVLGLGNANRQGDKPQREGELVKLFTPRMRQLIENHASYVETNEVERGICGSAEGPDGCGEYSRGSRPEGRKSATGRQLARGAVNDTKQGGVRTDQRAQESVEVVTVTEAASSEIIMLLQTRLADAAEGEI